MCQRSGYETCTFFFSSRRRHTRLQGDWSSDVCSSDLPANWTDMPDVVVDDASVLIDPAVPWTGGRQAAVGQKYASYMNALENVFNGPGYSLFTSGIRIDGSTNVTVSGCSVSLHTIGVVM